ncbi:NEL-type E3 ubiquitin ligase domain-containing protein [Pseudomonas sp. P9_2]|uniref:NEL-type E3 ubiquitin ligase domain-containing protein n=1 Tax=Pseudomonas sp. P9_2 TaxID=3043447 RepID=UPI002A35F729|nr:NEL-type E3 ubiquitin ligase domain-containing protein [Pseudomonas sp. P9_2]WPN50786.1 NEL-type E3 ubiquitin ligase domain-containing protein [Pseudomonas sp. P9_2]
MSNLDQRDSSQSVVVQSVHAGVIQDRLPPWYGGAALKHKKKFSETQLVVPQWYKNVSPERKLVVSTAYERCFRALNKLDARFNEMQGAVAFSEPLLVAAMKEEFGGDYDVRRLFFAREVLVPADRSKVFGPEASCYYRYEGVSLIEAALNNFAVEDTLEVADEDARLITRYDFHERSHTFNQADVLTRKVSIKPHVFASLCRTLDLGSQYLRHVESFVSPADTPNLAMGNPARAVRHLMIGAAMQQLAFAAEMAVECGDIEQDAYQLVRQLMWHQKELKWRGKPVSFSCLKVLGQPLAKIIVIGNLNTYPVRGVFVHKPEPCLVFIPGDPVCMLKEYPDLSTFGVDLVGRLCVADYRVFFSQFIPHERQSQFYTKLKRSLDPTDQFAELEDFDADKNDIRTFTTGYGLRLSLLWQDYARQNVDLMLDNTRAIAVSTDAADTRARNAWLVKLGSTALNVLNVAVLVFPELAPVMLLVGAVQMLQEIGSGMEAWEEGDKKAAWAHVSNIAFNAATTVVGAKLLPLVNTAFVESLAHVRCPDGNIRLYSPALKPYQRQVTLPDGLSVNEHGLYEFEGGLYLRENNTYYLVERVGTSNHYKILHPDNAAAYTPKVSRTRAGAWAHEHENPLTLTDSQLMQRLGPTAERFANEPLKLERIVQMSETNMDTLRKIHADQSPLPALLADTLKRLEMDSAVAQEPNTVSTSQRAAYQSELFAQRYAAAENAGSEAARLIKRVFPSLPQAVIEELLNGANSVEMKSLIEHNRVPLRLAEEARHYQRQVRLARAYEGLYRKTLGNDDTQRMVLHSLSKLPGWPADLRINIVERLPVGERLLDSVGPENAVVKRRFIKFGSKNLYEVQDDKFAILNSQADIYGAVLSALSPEEWAAMKLTAHDRGASLKQVLEQMPLMPRDELCGLLQMQPVKPRYRPPMRLAGGRVGYPLSPVGAASRRPYACERAALELYPSKSIAQVEQMLDLKDVGDIEFLAKIKVLNEEFEQLKTDLNAWRDSGEWHQRRSRGRVVEAIKDAWQRRSTQPAMAPEQEGMKYILRLADEQIGELPPIAANMDHVDCLDLSRMYLSDASLPFLNAFGGLRWLDISYSNFTRLPEFANGGAGLTTLNLSGNDIRLTGQSQARLEGMQRLTRLNLSHNHQLGWVADLSNMHDLNRLDLANTGTTTFPRGAEHLNNLAWIDLHTNAMTELPQYAVDHPDRISVHDNPVSEERFTDDHVTLADGRRLWLHDSPVEMLTSRGDMWDQLSSSPQAAAFFAVLADTTRCAEYTSGVTRPQLAERVWDMIKAVYENQTTREVLFKSADGRATCGDGSVLEFMNLEIDLLVEQSLEQVGEHEVEATFINTAGRLFRLKLVDIIAERDVEARGAAFAEETEVVLAYRTGLAQRLNLPIKTFEMLYRQTAGVGSETLDAAYLQVLEDEKNISEKSRFFVDMEFWRNQLRTQYSQEFNVLTGTDFELIAETQEALEEVADLQKTQGDPVEQDAKQAWQQAYDEAVNRVARLLGKTRDQILTDGSMTDAFYHQQMKQLGALRQSKETTAMQTLTVTVLNNFSAKKVASV